MSIRRMLQVTEQINKGPYVPPVGGASPPAPPSGAPTAAQRLRAWALVPAAVLGAARAYDDTQTIRAAERLVKWIETGERS